MGIFASKQYNPFLYIQRIILLTGLTVQWWATHLHWAAICSYGSQLCHSQTSATIQQDGESGNRHDGKTQLDLDKL
jgi:hypothetical protein